MHHSQIPPPPPPPPSSLYSRTRVTGVGQRPRKCTLASVSSTGTGHDSHSKHGKILHSNNHHSYGHHHNHNDTEFGQRYPEEEACRPSYPFAVVDELQALNTALCFLISINADAHEVEDFLLTHPPALLLEGTGPAQEESAHYILQLHSSRCTCFSPYCRVNRTLLAKLLQRGFEYYASRRLELQQQQQQQQQQSRPAATKATRTHMTTPSTRHHARSASYDSRTFMNVTTPLKNTFTTTNSAPAFPSFTAASSLSSMSGKSCTWWNHNPEYGHQLRQLERDIRQFRHCELETRHKLFESTMRIRSLQDQLERLGQPQLSRAAEFTTTTTSMRTSPPPPQQEQEVQQELSLANAAISIWTLCAYSRSNRNRGSRSREYDHYSNIKDGSGDVRGGEGGSSSLHAEQFAQRSVLLYQIGLEQLAATTLEREQGEYCRHIRSARRLQFGVLKTAFAGCRRHVCLSSTTASSATVPASSSLSVSSTTPKSATSSTNVRDTTIYGMPW